MTPLAVENSVGKPAAPLRRERLMSARERELGATCSQVMDLGSYPPDCDVFERDVTDFNTVYHNAYNDFYFSGDHTGLSGQTMNVSTWIDKINTDPHISLEGSKQTKQINITNGSYQEVITLQPYAVFLAEITLP
jgi:hypothetical protein